jgi:DNA-binding IclR family transcriptional regulator
LKTVSRRASIRKAAVRRVSVAPDDEENQSFTPPRAPLRVMNILLELANDPMGVVLARLRERLNLPKTTLLNLLRALEEAHYVVNYKGLYRLGEASLRLSSLIAVSFPFPHSLHDLLTDLMTRCHETAMLATLSEDAQAAVYVDKAECQRRIRYSNFIGVRRPLYSTSVGKTLLAFQDSAFIKHYLQYTKLEPMVAGTITEKTLLQRELAQIRSEGVATSIEEHSDGIGAIAAPVFDGLGVRAAVSVAGPAERVRSMREEYMREVRETGRQMSLLLGWKPSDPLNEREQAPSRT